MTRPRIKVANLLVKDRDGWKYKDAFVVVRNIEAEVKTSAKSKDGVDGYEETSTYNIEYTCNYWMDKATQEADLPSRALGRFVDVPAEDIYEVNGAGENILDDRGDKKPTGEVIPAHQMWTEKHTVDTDHLQSQEVLNSSMVGLDERNRLVELDVMRKFAQERT